MLILRDYIFNGKIIELTPKDLFFDEMEYILKKSKLELFILGTNSLWFKLIEIRVHYERIFDSLKKGLPYVYCAGLYEIYCLNLPLRCFIKHIIKNCHDIDIFFFI